MFKHGTTKGMKLLFLLNLQEINKLLVNTIDFKYQFPGLISKNMEKYIASLNFVRKVQKWNEEGAKPRYAMRLYAQFLMRLGYHLLE